jgi:trimeric autotransporter adhesin
MKTQHHLLPLFLLTLAFAGGAQTTTFTYQGRLQSDGSAFSGPAEFRFSVWDAAEGGTQLAATTPETLAGQVADGLFSLPLDFGAEPFATGADRWLQIALRTDLGEFRVLAPRQWLTSTPYAVTAGRLSGMLPAGQLTGTLPPELLPADVSRLGQSIESAHIADGTITAIDVNAASFNTTFWRTAGNLGTTAGVQFLGTTDHQPVEFKVNNERVLRLEFAPAAAMFSSPSPNVISGHAGNEVTAGVNGATLAGGGTNWFGATPPQRVGGDFSAIGGGIGNEVLGVVSTIAGGERAFNAFLGGGAWNSIHSPDSSLGGGRFNTIGTNAAGATIPGGRRNVAAAPYSLAAGHQAQALHTGSFVWADDSETTFDSTAINQFSIRATGGVRIVTSGAGLRVDGQPAALRAGGNAFTGQQTVTGGHVGIGTATPQTALHVVGNMQIGADNGDYRQLRLGGGNSAGFLYGSFPRWADGIHLGYNHHANTAGQDVVIRPDGATSRLTVGYGFIQLAVGGVGAAPTTQRLLANSTGVTVNGTFNNSSDRDAKQDFRPVNPLQVLEKVLKLPLAEWSYKEDPTTRHLGPVAQDFHAAFGIGTDEKHIAPLDEGGVALAAIQGLNHKVEDRSQKAEASIQELRAENLGLRRELADLKRLVEQRLGLTSAALAGAIAAP